VRLKEALMDQSETRMYPANNQAAFDRERAEFEANGWEVASINYQEARPGCSLPLIGVMMYRPAQTMVVTYRKR
jgi:hypothetical protein